jgi:hypothetical protein
MQQSRSGNSGASRILRQFELGAHTVTYICLYNESSSNLNYSTLETVRPQHDCPAACVVFQRYCSATLLSLRYHYRKEILGAIFKTVTILNFKLFKTA